MYGNGMNNPFIMSNMPYGTMMRGAPMMGNMAMMRNGPMMAGASRGGLSSLFGLGSRGGGLFAGTRSINFAGLLSNASKALGVVNQAIPIVKEVGPMVGNMRSMLKIASIFKDETDSNTVRSTKKDNEKIDKNTNNEENINLDETTNIKKNDASITSTNSNHSSFNYVSNEPNFFL